MSPTQHPPLHRSCALLIVVAGACGTPPEDGGERAERPAETFIEPALLDMSTGLGTLEAGLSKIEIDGKNYCLRSYNAQVPGPTVVVPAQRDGEERQLRVDLINRFERRCPGEVGGGVSNSLCACNEDDPSCFDFNTTNLHTHGLHVSPELNEDGTLLSDHVLVHVSHDDAMVMHDGVPIPDGACVLDGDGQRCSYEINVDQGSRSDPERDQHEPGTFWYHAHVHGTTAIQLANGMAGALVVEGPVDEIPAIAAAEDKLMVLQQIPFESARPLEDGEECDPNDEQSYSINDFSTVTTAERTLVNGVLEPVIYMDAGEVQRWRLVLAGISAETKVAIRGPVAPGECASASSAALLPLQEIAADGITFTHAREREILTLDPGYRSDILVQIPSDTQGQEFCVFDDPGQGLNDPSVEEPQNLIARIYVDGEREVMELPSDAELAAIAKPPLDCSEEAPDRTTVFDQLEDADGNECPSLNIDCKLFPDQSFSLLRDEQETWALESQSGTHSFHIHVNPFTVCEEDGVRLDEGYWRDTLLMQQDLGYEIRSRYEAFTGKFVTHCHKLQHEDRGMMAVVEISAP